MLCGVRVGRGGTSIKAAVVLLFSIAPATLSFTAFEACAAARVVSHVRRMAGESSLRVCLLANP